MGFFFTAKKHPKQGFYCRFLGTLSSKFYPLLKICTNMYLHLWGTLGPIPIYMVTTWLGKAGLQKLAAFGSFYKFKSNQANIKAMCFNFQISSL